MSKIKELAARFKELENKLKTCTRCGMCQAVCPLFAETGREADLARGKLALLDGLADEMFSHPERVSARLNRCLMCGSCQAGCSSGVDVLEIFLKARAILADFNGLPLAQKILFRNLLAKPASFNALTETVSKYQRLFLREANKAIGTSCTRIPTPRLGSRHIVPLSAEPFHKRLPELDTAPGAAGLKVGFFVGCLIDKIFPQTAEATIQALQHHGVGIWMPKAQGCCGIPALSSGDANTFDQLVRYSIDQFQPQTLDYIVTSCATCTFTIRKIWPMMCERLPSDQQEAAARMAEKTMDISQFLVDILGVSPSAATETSSLQRITYHDPCHLKKSLGLFQQPRTLIQANPDARLVEMTDADRCCGLGGSFNLHHYELSAGIGDQKAACILDTGCKVVATGCPACMAQLSDALSRSGSTVSVRHTMEIYCESLRPQ